MTSDAGGKVLRKRCFVCKGDCPASEFVKSAKSKDGLGSYCRPCRSAKRLAYERTDRAKILRRESDRRNPGSRNRWRSKANAKYNADPKNQVKIKSRAFHFKALRKKFLQRPLPSEIGGVGQLEFHHPDYSRPYLGVWIRTNAHKSIHVGDLPCPPCTDYTREVLIAVLKDWGIPVAQALEILTKEKP